MPLVVEQTAHGERQMDIWSRLMKDRIVFLGTPVDSGIANLIIAQFLFLESQDPDKEIMFYINSPGGYVTSGLAIYDTMQFIKADVSTMCIGQAASMGAVLLAGGGFKGGCVVGSSDEVGAKVKERPVYPADLLGTFSLLAGIDATAKLPHPLGFEAHVLDTEKEGMRSTGMLEEIL